MCRTRWNVQDECGTGAGNGSAMGWQVWRGDSCARQWWNGVGKLRRIWTQQCVQQKHRKTENWPESPSQWAPVVKIVLWLTWVTFTVGTRWSAFGVRCRARRREEKAEVGRWWRGEGEGDEMGMERDWTSERGAIRCLTMYMGMSYILQASRCPCGMYKAGWWLCTPSDSELGTWSLSQ